MSRLPEIHMSGLSYGIVELAAPWAAAFPAENFAQLVVVRRGSCWFECSKMSPSPVHAAEGGMIVSVGGGTQIWRSNPDVDPPAKVTPFRSVPLGEFQRTLADHESTELLVGRATRSANRLLPAFPTAFYLPPNHPHAIARIRSMLELIELEYRGGDDLLEREGIIRRAAEIMTIVLARYVKEQLTEANPNWPQMATDSQVMRAMLLIEKEPSKPWTVESLAGEVGMGRSAFAVRFRQLVGDTPMNALMRRRMEIAADAIRDGKRSTAAIAESIGYQSEPAFIKSFRRNVGMTPGRYRAQAAGRSSGAAGRNAVAGECRSCPKRPTPWAGTSATIVA